MPALIGNGPSLARFRKRYQDRAPSFGRFPVAPPQQVVERLANLWAPNLRKRLRLGQIVHPGDPPSFPCVGNIATDGVEIKPMSRDFGRRLGVELFRLTLINWACRGSGMGNCPHTLCPPKIGGRWLGAKKIFAGTNPPIDPSRTEATAYGINCPF